MKDQLDRLESKLDKTIEAVTDIALSTARLEVHVEKNTENLEEHMRRTELAEMRIERLEKAEHWVKGAVWVVVGIGTLILAVLRVFN